MSSHYYEREDEPDMTNPATAVQMYREQREALPAIELATRSMEDIYQVVNKAYEAAGEMGAMDMQNSLAQAWEQVTAIYQSAAAYNSTLAGADAALAAMDAQRANAVAELEVLLNSIVERDYDHPVVADLLSTVQEEVEQANEWHMECMYERAYEDAYEAVESDITDEVYDDTVRQVMNLGHDLGIKLGQQDAERLYELLRRGYKPLPHEAEAIRGLMLAVVHSNRKPGAA